MVTTHARPPAAGNRLTIRKVDWKSSTGRWYACSSFLFSRLFLFLGKLVLDERFSARWARPRVDIHIDACRSWIFNELHIPAALTLSQLVWRPFASTIDFCYRARLCSREGAWNARLYEYMQGVFFKERPDEITLSVSVIMWCAAHIHIYGSYPSKLHSFQSWISW